MTLAPDLHELVTDSMWIYTSEARRLGAHFVDDDTMQTGAEALCRAAQSWRPEVSSWRTHAGYRGRVAIMEHRRQWVGRRATADRVQYALGVHHTTNARTRTDPFDQLIDRVAGGQCAARVEGTARDREILARWLNGEILAAIAADHDISEGRASQICRRLIAAAAESNAADLSQLCPNSLPDVTSS